MHDEAGCWVLDDSGRGAAADRVDGDVVAGRGRGEGDARNAELGHLGVSIR